MSLAVFLLTLGAAARVTRLITDDRILGGVRAWVMRRLGPDHPVTYWVYCPWCVSPYVCAALFTLAWFVGETPGYLIPAFALTASWLIGVAATLIDVPAGEQ